MSIFARKPKHRHEWSPWQPEVRTRHSLRASRDFDSWDETVNVRRCQFPKCRITQEIKASRVGGV